MICLEISKSKELKVLLNINCYKNISNWIHFLHFFALKLKLVVDRLPELLAQFDIDALGVDEIDDEFKLALETAKLSHNGR